MKYLIIFLDVLEHIDNFDSFFNNLRQILKSDGVAIMSVPAYQALFSKHDEELHHFRRYNWNMIQDQIKNKFFLKKRFGYNYILLPIRFIQIKLIKKPKSETTVNLVLNFALKLVIYLEDIFIIKGRASRKELRVSRLVFIPLIFITAITIGGVSFDFVDLLNINQ